MTTAFIVVIISLGVLVWSADRFVDGASSTARHFGMPPLLIGMLIVGFGTSAPEMLVSSLAAWQGNPGIALGNAYGSNIANIALILGVTAMISPIAFHSNILRKELPILTMVTGLTVMLVWDTVMTRLDAGILLVIFAGFMFWSIRQGMRQRGDTLEQEMQQELSSRTLPLNRALFWLILGLLLLIGSSRALVWGAVTIATAIGISELVVGLTVVAIGTSLPELASSIMAIRKKEHDIALGNVIGSNLFNTLAVVGLAGSVRPLPVPPEALSRDIPLMAGLTLALFVIGYGFRGRPGRINRIEGAFLVITFCAYTAYLVASIT